MTDEQIKLIIGSLLHDIGKVVYRTGNGQNHSQSGYEFVKQFDQLKDNTILNCIRYHHAANLKNASLQRNDFAYITCFADNIAAAVDRRDGDNPENGFDKTTPLYSVFNILNGNNEKKHYAKQVLDIENEINYPTDKAVSMDESFYKKIINNISDNLRTQKIAEEYVNSLLSILESNLTYIPSSTSKRELADISLYDHVKITAALASCILEYLKENNITDYKTALFDKAKTAYGIEMFRLYSMDVSGIQKFIYQIPSEGALRELRGRSFYLEILMEHIIDELLQELNLSRANLIYSGGGHCYILIPNTKSALEIVERKENETNEWFIKWFGTELYVAAASVQCSAENLQNVPEGSYSNLYRGISAEISGKKLHRYSAEQIIALNFKKNNERRECKSCRKASIVNSDGRCPVCAALHRISTAVLYSKFFVVLDEAEEGALPLTDEKFLVSLSEEKELIDYMKKNSYIRSYSKNKLYTGKSVSTKLWIGDYTTGDQFNEFAKKAEGIERIAVLRADVDNLGQTFVSGFDREDGNKKYVTLSRSATLSRQLSLFFKCYINKILKNGESEAFGGCGERKVTIVYSGGDDVFLVGAWNEVIAAFVDLKNALYRFTQNTLTVSGGIGIYQSGFPVNIMAKETEGLEEAAKSIDGKNAISLFETHMAFSWNKFLNNVMGEKFAALKEFFTVTESRGKAFLYNILELLRSDYENELQSQKGGSEIKRNKLNIARFVYLISRMEPDIRNAKKENIQEASRQKEAYRKFADKMYNWSRGSLKDKQELIMAIYLYVYLMREREQKNEDQ